jgi:hypothetical protein
MVLFYLIMRFINKVQNIIGKAYCFIGCCIHHFKAYFIVFYLYKIYLLIKIFIEYPLFASKGALLAGYLVGRWAGSSFGPKNCSISRVLLTQ